MATFKKKPISAQAVALAVEGAAHAPIVGDPRMTQEPAGEVFPAPAAAPTNLGSSQDGQFASVGQIISAPLSRIKSNPFNPRAVYTNTAIDEMAVSLQTHGQRVAALGFRDDDGSIVLIEGETRLRGARAAGVDTLRIEIIAKPDSDQQLYEMARAANVERRDQTPLDDALKWKELLHKQIYPTQVALANALGLKEDHVSRTLSLAQLPQKVIIACYESPDLLTGKMLNALREYWQQEGDEKCLALIREAASAGLGYRDVVAKRRAASKGPVKRTRASSESLTYRGATGQVKVFDDDGRLELVLKGLTADDAAAAMDKIRQMFSKDAAT
jgi:ParB family chromosome partitioning protein